MQLNCNNRCEIDRSMAENIYKNINDLRIYNNKLSNIQNNITQNIDINQNNMNSINY